MRLSRAPCEHGNQVCARDIVLSFRPPSLCASELLWGKPELMSTRPPFTALSAKQAGSVPPGTATIYWRHNRVTPKSRSSGQPSFGPRELCCHQGSQPYTSRMASQRWLASLCSESNHNWPLELDHSSKSNSKALRQGNDFFLKENFKGISSRILPSFENYLLCSTWQA